MGIVGSSFASVVGELRNPGGFSQTLAQSPPPRRPTLTRDGHVPSPTSIALPDGLTCCARSCGSDRTSVPNDVTTCRHTGAVDADRAQSESSVHASNGSFVLRADPGSGRCSMSQAAAFRARRSGIGVGTAYDPLVAKDGGGIYLSV